MKKLLCILFFITFLNANLVTTDVFENGQNVVLKLSFDTPYFDKITQNFDKNTGILTIILDNLETNEKFNHQISSNIISDFLITPFNGNVKIDIKTSKNLDIKAVPSSDKLTLNLNFSDKNMSEITPNQQKNITNNFNLNIVFAIFVILIIIILLFKKLKKRNSDDIIFNNLDQIDIPKCNDSNLEEQSDQKIVILSQKTIKKSTKMAILGVGNKKFILILGKKNVVFEKDELDKNLEILSQIAEKD